MNTKNSVAFVSGANRGIGRAFVETLLARGARRIYAAARNPTLLEPVVALDPARVIPIKLDITNLQDVQAAADLAADVNLLINNAGVLASGGLLSSDIGLLRQDIDTNYLGTLTMLRHLVICALQHAPLRRSKTDQDGAGFTKGILVGTSDATYPKCALEAWLQLAGITSGPIFRPVERWGHVGNRALSSLGVARAVKRALTALEMDTTEYSGHSLHAKLVTDAAMAGVNERVIMQQTGHKNTAMLRRYIREGSLFRENAASAVGL